MGGDLARRMLAWTGPRSPWHPSDAKPSPTNGADFTGDAAGGRLGRVANVAAVAGVGVAADVVAPCVAAQRQGVDAVEAVVRNAAAWVRDVCVFAAEARARNHSHAADAWAHAVRRMRDWAASCDDACCTRVGCGNDCPLSLIHI